MTPTQLREHCVLKSESQKLFQKAITDLNFSARAYDRILKVARTIADLADAESIETEHLLEALSYRSLDRKMWN
jgi:magnesium chelatase family protein